MFQRSLTLWEMNWLIGRNSMLNERAGQLNKVFHYKVTRQLKTGTRMGLNRYIIFDTKTEYVERNCGVSWCPMF